MSNEVFAVTVFVCACFVLAVLACWLALRHARKQLRKPVPSNIVYVPMAKGINPNQPEVVALREQTKR